jgi:hypothetical protein
MFNKVSFKNYFLVAVFLNILTILAPLLLGSLLPPLVPLFYGRPVGERQLISTLGLSAAPVVSLLITAVNLLINLWVEDLFIKRVLAVSALTVSVLTTITVIKIAFLVGFF